MRTQMTKDDVFEAVLEMYLSSEKSLIWETSWTINNDIEQLSQEAREWRTRYYQAEVK